MSSHSPAKPLSPETLTIPMRDGVTLAADLHLPPGETGPWPVLLAMTPYGRRGLAQLAAAFVPAGYAVLVVDVRGRYDSGGSFQPVIQERQDGPDLMIWLGEQPWLDREAGVGIVGLSYLATAGFLAAADSPLVKAMTCVTVVVSMEDSFYRAGVLDLHHAFPWCIITGASPQPDLRRWDWPTLFRHLPLATLDRAAEVELPVWKQLVEASRTGSELAPEMDISGDMDRCRAPVLHLAGWYDFMLGESLTAHRILTKAGNAQQALVLGPWSHTTIMSGETMLGGHDFGAGSSSATAKRLLGWFDYWLKGSGAAPATVQAYITGEGGGWREAVTWPPTAPEQRLYLSDNTVEAGPGVPDDCGSGRIGALLPAPPESEAWLEYEYDPEDPTPTIGGAVWPFAIAGLNPGPADQRPLLDRTDGLAFATPPLSEAITVLGPVSVELTVTSDAPSTDFAVRIADVSLDGAWRIIQDGIQRVRFSQKDAGRAQRVTIDCWAAGHRWAPGHRIGLHIASANFPKYSRNLNTGGDPMWECEPRRARQRVRVDASWLRMTLLR